MHIEDIIMHMTVFRIAPPSEIGSNPNTIHTAKGASGNISAQLSRLLLGPSATPMAIAFITQLVIAYTSNCVE